MYQVYCGVMNKQVNRPDENEYLTVDEAAKELGIKPTAIRNYLTWGKMTTYKFKTLTLLKRSEVDKWKERQK
jgi:excisionase family DNA binding protein